MPIKKNIIFIIIIIFITVITVINFKKQPDQLVSSPPPREDLRIISTNPDPLEGATILPTQSIEVTFNKPVNTSEFKHRFDPEIDHRVETTNNTFRIIFNKPLKLGSGYTLFILPNTHTEDGLTFGHEIIYHFKTIKFRGV